MALICIGARAGAVHAEPETSIRRSVRSFVNLYMAYTLGGVDFEKNFISKL
jgi:hypothetical protein